MNSEASKSEKEFFSLVRPGVFLQGRTVVFQELSVASYVQSVITYFFYPSSSETAVLSLTTSDYLDSSSHLQLDSSDVTYST